MDAAQRFRFSRKLLPFQNECHDPSRLSRSGKSLPARPARSEDAPLEPPGAREPTQPVFEDFGAAGGRHLTVRHDQVLGLPRERAP